MPTPLPSSFSGFQSPNYTMVPDQLFDELLVELSGAELKTLLYIIRRTFGFKRDSDAISLSQMLGGITTRDGRVLDRGVGLSKPTLLAALRSLVERNIIESERQRSAAHGDEPTVYRLKFASKVPPQGATPPPGKETLPPPVVKNSDHPVVKKVAPQETVLQDIELSNIRKEKSEEKELSDPYAATTLVIEETPAHETAIGDTQTLANDIKHTQTVSSSSFTPIGASLQRRRAGGGEGSRERDAVLSCIAQFAEEFGDRASLKSSTSRAYNLLRRSGLSQERFVNCMWEARAITKDRISGGGSLHIKAKMGYFFSVLTERLGLQDAPVSDDVSTAKHGTAAP